MPQQTSTIPERKLIVIAKLLQCVLGPYALLSACRVVMVDAAGRASGHSFCNGNGNRNHPAQNRRDRGFESDDRAALSEHSHLLLLHERPLLLLREGAEVGYRVLDLGIGELAFIRRHLALAVGGDRNHLRLGHGLD